MQAKTGDLVRMPEGLPHAYYNKQKKPARALFSVTPARRLRELFNQLHNLGDPDEWFAARRSARLISCRRAQCLARDRK